MAKLTVLNVLSTVQILFFTLRKGKKVGMDEFGNTYYKCKPRKGTKRERRWVLYKGKAEASAIPPEWHGWMHHQTDDLPEERQKQSWQKPHESNKTGTEEAYLPPGHVLKGGKRPSATGDYQAWKP